MTSKLNKARAREYQARCQRNQTEERYQIQKAKLEAARGQLKILKPALDEFFAAEAITASTVSKLLEAYKASKELEH